VSASYTLTLTRTDAAVGAFVTGAVDWLGDGTRVHSPVAVRPGDLAAPRRVGGDGVAGSTRWSVTPGGDEDLAIRSAGLTAAVLQSDPADPRSVHSGSGEPGDFFEFPLTVDEGSEFLRIDLDGLDESADIDLTAFVYDDGGEPIRFYTSNSTRADERIEIADPIPGSYLVYVDFFADPVPTAFDLRVTDVDGGGVPVEFSPSAIPATPGADVPVTASWQSLAPSTTYLGVVHYGGSDRTTLLEVTTTEDTAPPAPEAVSPPTVSGVALVGRTLTADPGKWDTAGLRFGYQWQSDGRDIPGATGSTFRVTQAVEGTEVRVTVVATSADRPPGRATSNAVFVKYRSSVTAAIRPFAFFSWQQARGKVTVTSTEPDPPTGTVVILVDGHERKRVVLRGQESGAVDFRLPRLRPGLHLVRAVFLPGSGSVLGATSRTSLVWTIF